MKKIISYCLVGVLSIATVDIIRGIRESNQKEQEIHYDYKSDSLLIIYNELWNKIAQNKGNFDVTLIDQNTIGYKITNPKSKFKIFDFMPIYNHPDSLRASIGRLERKLNLIYEEKQFE